MRKHLHKLFAISMAMALGLMAQAQNQFQAVVPSGQTLNFKIMGATTCRVWYNDSGVVGDLVIPETVEHEGTTYRVTSMVDHAFEPSSNSNDLTSVVIPSSITYLPKGAFWRCDGLKSVWLPPTLTSIGESAFRGCKSLTKVIIPASVNSIGLCAFASQVFPGEMVLDTVIFLREEPPTFGQNVFHTGVSRTVKIWSPLHRFRADNPYITALRGQTSVSFTYTVYDYHSTPAHVNHIYDTIHPGESRTFAGRILTAGGDYTDSTWYYTHDSLITLHLTAVQWHFYANAPTGQRLYYRITGADSVEVVAPNGNGWAYYTPPTDSLAIPATVTHDGHTYSVFRIAHNAFYLCDAISALTLSEGISEVGTDAFHIRRTSQELRVSLPRSLRIIGDAAFNTTAFNSRLKLASDTIWAEVIGREAFFPKVISQPIVLPNVRSIGDKGFYRISSCPYLWVGDSCTSIGEQAFAENTTVSTGPIPGRISLGTSLQSVGASAFSRPNGYPIHSVEFRGTTVPSFAADVFKNTQIDSIITPCGTSAAYRAALDAAPVNEDWDASATLFAERGCDVVVDIYDTICASWSYSFGSTITGISFAGPGSHLYYDTVHLSSYDSITVLHLEVEGIAYFPLTNLQVCDDQLPYSWHDTTITEPGYHLLGYYTLSPRGCYVTGERLGLTVHTRPHTYIYDTVRSTAKGYDYSDTTETTVPVNNYPCRDSLVTTITWHDFDETTDTVRNILYDTICAGTIYHFGGRYLLRSGTYYDTVRMPFRDSITVLHLEVEGTMANSLHTEVICETSLPYIWDGDTITTPGTHHLDHSVFNPRGCLMSGSQLQLTVAPRAKTYIYDTVVSTAKGYDYDDTTQVSMLRQGSHNSPCPDSLVTTYTHYDLDESVDTLRVYGSHQQCDGTYLFGGIERTATGIYTDTVVVDPFHVTISTLDLTINYSNTGDTAAVVCDVFTWHGVDYTASAAPQHVYTNAAGCDSTVTLALTVNYSNTGDTAAVACDAFTWHGVDYTASAAPQYVYTNAAGCDSTVTLALTVNYSNTGDTAAVVCDAFTWHGTTYTASAAPQHVYTNAAGCDSTVTLALTVNYSNTGDTAAVACDAFTWHGVDYTASAAPQHVYTNAAGCDSTVTLTLTVNYSNTGDTAAVACDAFTWHGTTYTAAAAPQHVYTNAAGCDSTVTLALTVNYSNTGDTAAVACDAFTWHGTTYTASAAPQHVYTNAAGCDSTVTLALTVNYSNTGDTAAVACDAFTWHGTTYTASAAPQYVYTNAAGCDSTVTLALTVNYSNTGDTAAVACDAFTWHGVDYTASAAPQHVYTNAAGCDSTVTLALTVNYSNTGDTAAVACDAFAWHGVDYTASAAPQHVYTNAAGCDSTVTLALTVNYSNTGTETADVCDEYTWQGTTYTVSNTTDQVVLTNVAGCDSTVTLNLTVRHSSVGDTAAVAFDAFTWYGHTYRATTTATHTLTTAEGCDSTVTLALTILESYSTDAAFGENGIEVEAYGYCAGPGAVRYRLSSGQPNEYRLAFAHAAFPAADWMPITTPGSIDIEVPAGLVTGDYSATLQFRHSSWPELTSAAIPVVIHVNLPETYVQPLFNDVIALVDTCQCLTDVQWYHREAGETEWTLIPGANDYYYHQEGGLTGEYFVSAKMNGVETYTCPQSDMGTLITDGNITLTAYPNPTASVVTLTLDGSRRASHEVRVLTTTGIELERRSFEGDSLRMDLSAYPRGSYIVSVDGMAVRVIRN